MVHHCRMPLPSDFARAGFNPTPQTSNRPATMLNLQSGGARLGGHGFPAQRRVSSSVMTVYETTNHNTIYHWATSRGLYPACVAGEPTKIRLGGDPDANLGEELQPIEWWRWFQEFDRRNLQLIYDPSKGWFTLGSRLAPSGA
jgi:hypothetical protein